VSKSDQHGSKTESTSITFAPHLRSRPSSEISHGSFLDKETFSQLRKELFEGGSGKALGFSDDVNNLSKLISVVLKAGIEPLIRSDLTMTAENEEQITDCLKIIEAALEKSPGAIWGRPDLEIFGKPIDSPLHALIAIYLVHLGCKWRDRLGNSILGLLSIINESQNKITQFQHSQLPFSSILMLQCTGRRGLSWILLKTVPDSKL
jgi:serine/threonine-protein kinase ATR